MPFLAASFTFWGLDKIGARHVCMEYEPNDTTSIIVYINHILESHAVNVQLMGIHYSGGTYGTDDKMCEHALVEMC